MGLHDVTATERAAPPYRVGDLLEFLDGDRRQMMSIRSISEQVARVGPPPEVPPDPPDTHARRVERLRIFVALLPRW